MQSDQRKENPYGNRPLQPQERYRLYLDESGDHVFRDFTNYLIVFFVCLVAGSRQTPISPSNKILRI